MRGATLSAGSARKSNKISIHTPHTGSDKITYAYHKFETDFNPHSPCGERHYDNSNIKPQPMISIHTPHAGSDWRGIFPFWSRPLFQSTLPMRGATLDGVAWTMDRMKFQSTLPMRGATTTQDGSRKNAQISIHTPHAGSDVLEEYKPMQ